MDEIQDYPWIVEECPLDRLGDASVPWTYSYERHLEKTKRPKCLPQGKSPLTFSLLRVPVSPDRHSVDQRERSGSPSSVEYNSGNGRWYRRMQVCSESCAADNGLRIVSRIMSHPERGTDRMRPLCDDILACSVFCQQRTLVALLLTCRVHSSTNSYFGSSQAC